MLLTNVCENIVGLYVEVKVTAFFLGIFRQFYISPTVSDICDMLG
jgi:hypothetical protein